MHESWWRATRVALVVALGCSGATAATLTSPLRIAADYGKLPLAFEANHGQADGAVQFLARGPGYGLFLTPTEAVLHLRAGAVDSGASSGRRVPDRATAPAAGGDAVVRMRLAGAHPRPQLMGVEQLPGKSNYLVGNDPAQWRRDVPHYARVKYAGVYPGIDLFYYGNDRQLEYDFVVAPGANPKRIALDFGGVEKLALDRDGNLVLTTAAGTLVQHKPVIYQEIDGLRHPIDGRYVLRGKSRAGFVVARYDATQPLVIDPVLAYSTYLGGAGEDWGTKIALDSAGNVYLAGNTTGVFPATAGALQPAFQGTRDVVVTKLNASGTSLIYSTYLGGSGEDFWGRIAVDANGHVYVAGATKSANFPVTTGAYQKDYRGGGDYYNVFVAKLNADGTALDFSTYVGGTEGDILYDMALDAAGNVFVVGYTLGDFPATPGAFQTSYGGGGDDAFVFKLNATGTALLYATYIGGPGNDFGSGIAIDGEGNAYVTGGADLGFPVTAGAFQTTYGGGNRDAFVAKLNPDGSALVYSTYLGGNATLGDYGNGIAVDAAGNAYMVGFSHGAFPTTAGAYQTTHGGGPDDIVVVKLNATGSALIYSTYIGGSGSDEAEGLALDDRGYVYVIGASDGGFPTTANALQAAPAGVQDTVLAVLSPTGSALVYSTYLGSIGDDYPLDIALDSGGNVYVSGRAGGSGFPTTPGAFQTSYGGGMYDSFLVKFTADSGLRNYQGLWWRFPAGSESGWGINFTHQGDIIFATWFTYDGDGKPLWLIALLDRQPDGTYSGPVSTLTGPPFFADPWDPLAVVETFVGTTTVTFTDGDNATFAYTVNGVTQSKPITRQLFAEPVARCFWGAFADLSVVQNFQDLWWKFPAGSESGWGANFTHQGNVVFVTWFTYGADGKPLWLIALLDRQPDGTYSGPVSTLTGPPFFADPWDPLAVADTIVGSMTVTFANGNRASYAYTVNGIAQTKEITRQVFAPPGTACLN